MRANEDVRRMILENGLKNWQVAGQIGISDTNFSKWLRFSLNEERRERTLRAIEELKNAAEN